MKFNYVFSDNNASRTVLGLSNYEQFNNLDINTKFLNLLNLAGDNSYNICKLISNNYSSMLDLYDNNFHEKYAYKFKDSLDFILSDYRWNLIFERKFFNSNTHFIIKLKQLVNGCCKYIESKDIKYFFIGGTPHCIETWVLSMLIEHIYSGEVYILEDSVVPGYTNILYGIDKQNPMILDDRFIYTNIYSEKYWKNYIQLQQQDKNKKDLHGRRAWLFDLDKYNGWNFPTIKHYPKRLIQKIYGKYLYGEYQKNQVMKFPLKKKSITFFLHHQPERSTLPMGLKYCEQYSAISDLRNSLPEEYTIYVKEHPYTFKNPLDPRFRTPTFFEEINSLKNVKLINPLVSSFELIDQSLCTATVTGRVGFQSLLRGVPTIAFGLAPYREHKSCHVFDGKSDTKTFIEQINNQKINKDTEDFFIYLSDKCTSSIEVKENESMDYNNARVSGWVNMLNSIFK